MSRGFLILMGFLSFVVLSISVSFYFDFMMRYEIQIKHYAARTAENTISIDIAEQNILDTFFLIIVLILFSLFTFISSLIYFLKLTYPGKVYVSDSETNPEDNDPR